MGDHLSALATLTLLTKLYIDDVPVVFPEDFSVLLELKSLESLSLHYIDTIGDNVRAAAFLLRRLYALTGGWLTYIVVCLQYCHLN